ncbi:MAG: hypothetical protein R2813_06775 [Flavobacteriales bacterium]
MEKFWLVIAILSFVYAVYMIGKQGLSESIIYLIFPLVAGALFYMRYFMRKRFEKGQDDE